MMATPITTMDVLLLVLLKQAGVVLWVAPLLQVPALKFVETE